MVTGTSNRGPVIYVTPVGGMLAFVMQSAGEDDLLDQVFATLDDSAERQFTGTRGALFWVAFQGIDSAELLSLHERDSRSDAQPTPIKRGVSNFLHRAPDQSSVSYSVVEAAFPPLSPAASTLEELQIAF